MRISSKWVSIVVVIITSVLCSFIPLLSVIGYEFAALHAIILSFLAGTVTIGATRSNLFKSKKFRLNKKYYYYYLVLLIIPVTISSVNTLFFRTCPIGEGLLFYFLFVPPAMFIGIVLGALASLFKKFRFWIFLMLFLVILFSPLLEIYLRPQVYLYHSIFTYFPGTMYDEGISITSKMILFRLFSMFPFAIVLFLLTNRKITARDSASYSIMIVLLILYTAALFVKPELEFSTTEKVLKNHLSGEVITDHFVISYPASLPINELNNQILHHEFFYKEIEESTGIRNLKKIKSFIFRDKKQKRELFGAGNADVAKPWLGQIYTGKESYNTSLKHEIVHAFASNIGSTLFKIADKWNPAMLEGYAMAIENNYASYDIHYLAFLARKNDYHFAIPSLFSGFNFLSGTSSISYIYAGSFIKFLIDEYGIEKVNDLYSNLDFRSIFGKEIIILEADYYNYLDSIKYVNNSSTAKLFFGHMPIFKKTCPRATANRLEDAWEHYSVSDYFEAYKMFKQIYEFSGSYSALTGSIQALEKMGEYDGAYKYLKSEYDKFVNSSSEFRLKIMLADLAAINGDGNYADILYKSIIENSPNEYYYSIASVRSYLKNNFPSDFSAYIKGSSIDRLLILLDRIDNRNRLHFTNLIISLAENNNLSQSHLQKIIEHRFVNDRYIYSYLNSRIGAYYLERGEFQKARQFSQLAFDNSLRERAAIYREDLEKSIWISTFADSILSNVKYK